VIEAGLGQPAQSRRGNADRRCDQVGIKIRLMGRRGDGDEVAPRTASICRDWIPYPLVGMFYWQAGRFVTRADVAFEAMLERADRRLVIPTLEWCARRPVGAWIVAYLELAYLAYYVSLPGSLAALYWCGRRSETDHLWTAVLLSAYASCGALVFLQTRPPRLIGEKMPLPSSRLRLFNLWILRHGSVQTNTCPSAHVAIATACALILLRACPGWVGPVFLAIAISIALGAVAGRYHYAADAIAGVLVAVAAFAAETVLAATGA
jgi:membrane-associated phospholipid phosphatase